MASFINNKLVYEGYIYVKCKNGKDGKLYWRCENWRSGKCGGTSMTDKNEVVTVGNQHNHGPSPTRIELARIKDRINQAAISSALTPRAIVNSQLAGISDQAKTALPKLRNLEKTVGRKRYADGQQVPVPHLLSEINIPEQLRRTKTDLNEDFIMADTGPEDPNRIIVLASRTDVARLASCDVWLCDGTFKSCPQLYYQLWVIHGRFRQAAVLPFIYALLPSKTRECYRRALDLVLIKIDEVNLGARPNVVVIDFEKAEELALRTALPEATIHGCFFHFKQALWRKIQELGWAAKYQDEVEDGFRLHLKMFAALTFVNTVDTRNWFRQLAQIFLDVYGDGDEDGPYVAFVDYMEKTWVGREFVTPRFSLEMWNNRGITLDQMPRTTNSAESWHNSFSSIFHRHSPNPYKLVRALLDEQGAV
ncbi:hypothetical protein ACQ4LE_010923 [Meloidogyne hapla]